MMKVGDWIRFSAHLYPEKTAVIFGNARLTYREFNSRINRLAQALMAAGVTKGDRVAILATDCPQYLEINLAVARIGAVYVPLNFRWKEKEIEYGVNNAEAVAFFVGEEYTSLVETIRSSLPTVEVYVAMEGNSSVMTGYELFLSGGNDVEPEVEIDEHDVANIQYTSGTTGFPKGAMLTHRNIIMRSLNGIAEMGTTPHWVGYSGSPMFHVAGFYIHLPILMRGGTVVLQKQFNVERFAELIEKEKISYAFLVPAMINFLVNLEGVDHHDFSTLKNIFYGGSPISVEALKKAKKLLKGCNFWQAFGQTEDSPQTMLRPEDHITEGTEKEMRRLLSVGKPVFGHWLRIVNELDEDVPAGEVGEILCRSDQTMKGYWRNPDATRETLRGGWLHTGDMGKFDEDGYLYIVDRKNDMIIRGGENIYPAEIEQILYTHPKILEVAVIGVPDETWGEEVQAVVVLREGTEANKEEIIEFCRGKMAGYKRPRLVDFVDTLPRNPSGKVLKRMLKEQYWGNRERMV
ncbi:MAG: long-chain-fatty-acid--CoA ligase [Bacillota bacterium]